MLDFASLAQYFVGTQTYIVLLMFMPIDLTDLILQGLWP